MSVSDLSHEAAKRYCAAIFSRECVEELLERVGVPAAWREPRHVDALMGRCRQVTEAQLVELFTVAELAGLARFYGTPEGVSVARKAFAFTAAIVPALETEIVAWAHALGPSTSAGDTHHGGA